MSEIFQCECGCVTFNVAVRQMIGSDDDHIDRIVCIDCGRIYQDTPRPTQIEPITK